MFLFLIKFLHRKYLCIFSKLTRSVRSNVEILNFKSILSGTMQRDMKMRESQKSVNTLVDNSFLPLAHFLFFLFLNGSFCYEHFKINVSVKGSNISRRFRGNIQEPQVVHGSWATKRRRQMGPV